MPPNSTGVLKMGLDPNVWRNAIELAAARVIGREPVIYVRNILTTM